jgi:hypothetical protein
VTISGAGRPGRPRGRASYGGTALGPDARPELSDIGRLGRRLVGRAVALARAEDASVLRLLADHLGPDPATLPVATGSWLPYDQVNVQTGVDAWLAEPGRTHQLVGLTQFRHRDFGLAELMQDSHYGPAVGSVAMEARPDGPESVIARTEGVTASFIKELLRRAALGAAEDEDQADEDQGGQPRTAPLRVTDAHLGVALDQLLDARSALTRSLLGGGSRAGDGTS